MVHEVPESPRAVIRTWLRQTKDSSSSRLESNHIESELRVHRSQEARRYKTRANQEITSETRIRGHPKRVATAETETGQPLQRAPDKTFPLNSCRGQPQDRTVEAVQPRPRPRPGDPGFAESLGLHPPFRTFRVRSEDALLHQEDPVRTRKRKRKASSTFSYLEPAVVDEVTDAENGRWKANEREGTRRLLPSEEDWDLRPLCGFLGRPDQTTALPEKPAESYEKRPRHKTREDRYELKDGTREKKKVANKDSHEKKQKKHKRREKSGGALMHSFTAQNVTHDRLTLQPAKALGLFGKGRASSPVRRRGLPNSAFSETAFLNSHRARPEDNSNPLHTKHSDKKKKRKTNKAADIEAKISRYFTSAKVSRPSVPDPHPQERLCHQQGQRRQRESDSPLTFIDLPDKPFLGFGSSGAVSISPVRKDGCRALIDHGSLLTRSQSRSTGYFTWSQSEVRAQASPQCRDKGVVPLASSQCSNRRTPPVSSRAERPQPAKSSPAGRQLSGNYRDAATGTTPPDRPLTKSRTSGSPLHEDGRRGVSVCSLDDIRTRRTQAETGRRPSRVEPSPAEGRASGTSPRQSETKSQQHSSCGTNPKPVRPRCQREVFPNGSAREGGNSPHIDPLEVVLAELLREGKPLIPGEGWSFGYESQRPHYLRPEQEQTIDSRSGQPPNEPSPRVEPQPDTDRLHGPSLQYEQVASKIDSVDSQSPRYHGVMAESQHGQNSALQTSLHSVRSLTRPGTMEYVAFALPTPGRSRVDSRNASNGYTSLYARQESGEDGALLEGQEIDKESFLMASEVRGQPDGYMMPLAYQKQVLCNPISVEDHFDDYRPRFQEGYGPYHRLHDYAEYEPMHAEEFANQANDWDQPFLGETNNELGSAEIDSHYDGLQQHNDHTMSEPDGPVVTQGAVIHNPWHALPSLAPLRGVEASSIAQNRVDDALLTHFWTPHKLY